MTFKRNNMSNITNHESIPKYIYKKKTFSTKVYIYGVAAVGCFVRKFLKETSFQDSSLGSFEGEPGVSNESLSEIGGGVLDPTKNKGPRKGGGRQQRPVTSSLDSSSHHR